MSSFGMLHVLVFFLLGIMDSYEWIDGGFK